MGHNHAGLNQSVSKPQIQWSKNSVEYEGSGRLEPGLREKKQVAKSELMRILLRPANEPFTLVGLPYRLVGGLSPTNFVLAF